MIDKVIFYSIVGVGRSVANPSGLARRTYTGTAHVDESMRRDFTWGPTTAVTDWEYGNLPGELVEIDAQEAEALIGRFREKWA